ncbi:hypothetical protein Agabi119p4_7856 [Agaricus bisporus var. burnettii]|uniref:Uncharacterized protein n=1 Tax=Agaricus bisporus var. burnettii TaxID=192524 RepID=A0A8H7C8W3_AGABI|nr:hypothetical protein Agabi119p4_7856 [Agaricus bisporus var. burnettii]
MTYAATTAIITYQGKSQYPTRDWQGWMGLPALASGHFFRGICLWFNRGPLSNVVTTESKAISSALVVQALSSPRTRWKQPLISCMINSSSLALLNAASVPMCGVVCAVAVGHLPDIGFVKVSSEALPYFRRQTIVIPSFYG